MTANGSIDLNDYIRDVPDFPKPGILFKDITPLLGDARKHFKPRSTAWPSISKDEGSTRSPQPRPEGSSSARRWPFAWVWASSRSASRASCLTRRSASNTPSNTVPTGSKVHGDALAAGRRILLLDDVLATGGTMVACRDLVLQTGRRGRGLRLRHRAGVPGRTSQA